jgi:hypothetical protein
MGVSGIISPSFSLSGKVVDGKGAALEGVSITLVNARLLATSGSD